VSRDSPTLLVENILLDRVWGPAPASLGLPRTNPVWSRRPPHRQGHIGHHGVMEGTRGAYVIGEIGQNHNGSVDIARLIIELAARPVLHAVTGDEIGRLDAVKLTKRDLEQELADSHMRMPYTSKHSFGKTYGEHRQKLELSDEQHFELYKYAKSLGLDFVETLCAPGCLSILRLFRPDKLKVASRDLTNLPLLVALAETRIPMILSTGMAGPKELDDALRVIYEYHKDVTILHCVSEYPTKPENVNLRTITYLKKSYPQHQIGYSDHTIGISAPIAAICLGATVIEKHITLDRNMKGTDQLGSLGPEGLQRMLRDIRMLELSLGKEEMFICDSVEGARYKLERSIASRVDIEEGAEVSIEDVWLLSPGDGFKWCQRDKVLGRIATRRISKNEIIYEHFLK